MVMVSSFKLERNTETGVFIIISLVTSVCPLCGGFLKQRDCKHRSVKNMIGEIFHFRLRRLLCVVCERLHTEIPDIIQPYKHYDSETIQSVVDDDEKAKSCIADNSTISRWKASFADATPDIEQRLASIYACESDNKVPLVSPYITLVAIRAAVTSWLAFVMQLLINNGHKLCTRFAFCPLHYSDTIQSAGKNDSEGDAEIDKTITDTG
jgi:hypothetical protein